MSGVILSHGNYGELESYHKSVVIFEATYDFCTIFLAKGDRTIDQMIQAARSGKQNIVEGCQAAGISKETEIKLIGVARASLEELLEDYRDFLRTRNLLLWNLNDERIQMIRQLSRRGNNSYDYYKSYFQLDKSTPELFCNLLITLIHQTNCLLDHQLKSLEKDFVSVGGLRERMYRARVEQRNRKNEEALALLREIYRELASQGHQNLLDKIEKVARILKGR